MATNNASSAERAAIAQNHQIKKVQARLSELENHATDLSSDTSKQAEVLANIEQQLSNIKLNTELLAHVEYADIEDTTFAVSAIQEASIRKKIPNLATEITIPSSDENWDTYVEKVDNYIATHGIKVGKDPYSQILSSTQRITLEKRIQDEFSFKNANCDQIDYMIAGSCGMVGGLIDAIFLGQPGQGTIAKFADGVTDQAVQSFARLHGWSPEGKKNPVKSAIGFLENGGGNTGFTGYKVNYDQATGKGKNGVGGLFDMSTKNHHIKSLGHWPDLFGLFYSILNQFTSTSSFVDGGKIITIDTEKWELKGSTIIAKIFAGFVNWLGHLMSDVAGSSGAANRGSGIPIPFFGLLQFVNIGSFGQHRQTFAQISVQVFEKGYDSRHGFALAIPVLITELLVRLMWTFKQHFYHGAEWKDCIPSANNPEVRRMLLIGHGTLCCIDITDASIRSGGNIIFFLTRSNLIAWARFGTIALKELNSWKMSGKIDTEIVDAYLDLEYKKLLNRV